VMVELPPFVPGTTDTIVETAGLAVTTEMMVETPPFGSEVRDVTVD
jgi:hypothetical protein